MVILRFLFKFLTIKGHGDMFFLQVKATDNSKYFAKLAVPFHAILDFVLSSRVKLNYFIKGNILFELILLEIEFAVKLL